MVVQFEMIIKLGSISMDRYKKGESMNWIDLDEFRILDFSNEKILLLKGREDNQPDSIPYIIKDNIITLLDSDKKPIKQKGVEMLCFSIYKT